MSENNFCEKTQIAIMSDEELSEEQLSHIENCPECHALLSQIKEMKSSLSDFTVPGIRKGQVADRVMKKIGEKKSIPFPSIKLTRHIGTAASLIIICVIAFALRDNVPTVIPQNPYVKTADTAETGEGFRINGTFGVIENADGSSDVPVLLENEYKYADDEEIITDTVETETYNETGDAVVRFKSVRPEAEEQIECEESAESKQASEAPKFMMNSSPTADSAVIDEPAPEVYVTSEPIYDTYNIANEEMSAALFTEEAEADIISDSAHLPYSDGAGGGGGGASKESITDGYVFSGIEFLDGEENLEHNISLANNRLEELNIGIVITKEKLFESGFTNEFFTAFAVSMTAEELKDIFN